MIPQRNLSLLSNRLARRGGRRIPEAVLERDYCLSWFLVGLSRSSLGGRIAFKGGTALKKCYFGDYRFSEDLDFTLTAETPFEDIRASLDEIFKMAYEPSGVMFRFDREDRHAHENSYTFFLAYEGPLPSQRARTVKVDMTIRERVVYPLEERAVLRAYSEYADLPRKSLLRVYSLGEVGAEKAVSILDRSRTEPRDVYDLAFLIEHGHVDLLSIREGIELKLEFRGLTIDQVANMIVTKEERYRRLWGTRLADQMSHLPEFEDTFRLVRRAFRRASIR